MLLKSKFLLLAAAVLSITACNDDNANKQTAKTETGLKELKVGVCPGPTAKCFKTLLPRV